MSSSAIGDDERGDDDFDDDDGTTTVTSRPTRRDGRPSSLLSRLCPAGRDGLSMPSPPGCVGGGAAVARVARAALNMEPPWPELPACRCGRGCGCR